MSTNIDDWLEDVTDEQEAIALGRALRSCGIDFEWVDEGKRLIVTDEDVYDIDAVLHSDAVVDAFGVELKKLLINETLEDLKSKGILKSSLDLSSGELLWSLNDS